MTPKPNATQRTKNRLREHDSFVTLRHDNGRMLLECCCETHRNSPWLGWLPTAEVTV